MFTGYAIFEILKRLESFVNITSSIYILKSQSVNSTLILQ